MANESRLDSWPALLTATGDELIATQTANGDFASLTPNVLADLIVQKLIAALPYTYTQLQQEFSTNVEANNNNNPTNWQPISSCIMEDVDTVDGEYTIGIGFSWTSTSNNRAAYFRAIINGDPLPYVRVTSRDNQDLNPEFFRVLYEFDGNGSLEVDLECVLENGGGVSTVTIKPLQLGISIEAKKNFNL